MGAHADGCQGDQGTCQEVHFVDTLLELFKEDSVEKVARSWSL